MVEGGREGEREGERERERDGRRGVKRKGYYGAIFQEGEEDAVSGISLVAHLSY